MIVLLSGLMVGCSQPRLSPYERSRSAAERHEMAAADIQRLGGRVDPHDRGAAVTLYRTDEQATRDAVEAIRNLRDVDSLTLAPAQPIDLELESLGPLSSLRFLALRNVRLSPEDIQYLNALPSLRTVHLTRTGLTDQQVNQLTIFSDLRSLAFINEPVTDATLRRMEGFAGLRRLRLVNTEVTEDAARQLVEILPRLIIELDNQRIRGREAAE